MKKFAQLFVTFAFAFIAVFGLSTTSDIALPIAHHSHIVHASTVFDNGNIDSSKASSDGNAGSIINSIFKAANIFAGFVLGISIIMIIVGGLRYILANGDQRQAEQGKMILIYSGIGIVIALSAFVIAKLFASFKFGQ